MNREGEYISIAAYFKVNGIKVSKPEKEPYNNKIVCLSIDKGLVEQMVYWQQEYNKVWDKIRIITSIEERKALIK